MGSYGLEPRRAVRSHERAGAPIYGRMDWRSEGTNRMNEDDIRRHLRFVAKTP